MYPVLGIYKYDEFRTMTELLHTARLSKILFVSILWGWRGLTEELALRAVC